MIPAPIFEPSDTWDTWADKLLGWGVEEAKRRHELAGWYSDHCSQTGAK